MTKQEIIEVLEIAGYTNHHDFPDDYYVKEFTNDEGETMYSIIGIVEEHCKFADPTHYQIALASDDWMESVERSNHNKYSLEDTIYQADRLTY